MTKETIKKRLEAKPFVPFKVKIAGGGEFDVPIGDYAHLHPTGRTLFIHLNDGGTEIIDVALVSSIYVNEIA